MNKELIQQYLTFRNTNAVQSIEIVTSAGRSSIKKQADDKQDYGFHNKRTKKGRNV